jgi:uncharacterized protein
MQDLIQNALNFSFYLTVSILFISVFLLFKLISTLLRLITTFICLLMLAVSWMYFVEPNILTVKEVSIPVGINKQVLLLSDLHFGFNKNANFATKLAEEINKQTNIDMVLYAGDIVEKIAIEDLDKTIAPLSAIKFPQYAVLGNHDYKYAEASKNNIEPTEYSKALTNSLNKNSIKVIDNQSIVFDTFTLNGISSRATTFQTINLPKGNKNLVLTHEPITTELISDEASTLVLAGHSHCGQVKIPYLSEKFLMHKDVEVPVKDKYFEGLYDTPNKGKTFVSCGVGESTLPIRFLNPPTIYKINLN